MRFNLPVQYQHCQYHQLKNTTNFLFDTKSQDTKLKIPCLILHNFTRSYTIRHQVQILFSSIITSWLRKSASQPDHQVPLKLGASSRAKTRRGSDGPSRNTRDASRLPVPFNRSIGHPTPTTTWFPVSRLGKAGLRK